MPDTLKTPEALDGHSGLLLNHKKNTEHKHDSQYYNREPEKNISHKKDVEGFKERYKVLTKGLSLPFKICYKSGFRLNIGNGKAHAGNGFLLPDQLHDLEKLWTFQGTHN